MLAALAGCPSLRPQRGGRSVATLGGTAAPTVVTTAAPENPQTPTTTTVEKTTTREYAPAQAAQTFSPAAHRGQENNTRIDLGLAPVKPAWVRESVTEKATTSTGVAQKDTARDLAARLANMRGVMWVGVLLLVAGPIVGWRLGWLTNGLIAGAVGLALVILAQIVPGNEAWFGLAGLLLLPLVAFVYYRAHYDAAAPSPISEPQTPNR